MEQLKKEKKYEEVYGDTFALYSKKEILEFMDPFVVRFQRNGLDPKAFFQGKKCFDAGCGNGRGSIFMLLNGAESVTAFDFSEKNISSTKKNAKDFGFNNISVTQGTLESIPFADHSFEFVWCNGVIMHTGRPDKCLSEISRILRPQGKMWLYIYGSGGVYWRVIFHLRNLMKDVPVQGCIAMLKTMRYETRYVAEFIDDWYASYLRTYTDSDLSGRLATLGFDNPSPLKWGVDYDTSHRLNSFYSEEEKAMMGEGDLRYMLTKTGTAKNGAKSLDEGEYGSRYEWPKVITEQIDPIFSEVAKACGTDAWKKVAVAARIQRELRLMLTETRSFPFSDFKKMCLETLELAKSAATK